ncbi:MAG: prepilin-type N-terminal cleavage/methylation domain-containing protein [Armatimonadota bacterium]
MIQKRKRAFTLIELLVVIAVISILAAILFPVYNNTQLKAKVSRVHTELAQVAYAVELYRDDWGGYPMSSMACERVDDYQEIPPVLFQKGYLSIHKIYDPFNPVLDAEEAQKRKFRTYKYLAPGPGYHNQGALTTIHILVPEDYPINESDKLIRYGSPWNVKKCPIKYAIWSVGPGGNIPLYISGETGYYARKLPVPKKEWYPYRKDGIIVRFSDGRKSP